VRAERARDDDSHHFEPRCAARASRRARRWRRVGA
jgi:hypothetical protein